MNAKMIEALKGIRDNLSVIIDEAENTGTVTKAEKVVAPEETKKVAPAKEDTAPMSRKEREASEELPDVTGNLTEEQLNGLSYNNLKKLAKEMGISATGARDELTQKILNAEVSVDAEDDSDGEPDAEEAPKTAPRKVVKKIEEVEEDEEEVDPIVAKVNEAVEDMTDEEIMDVLVDVGVKAKGKRQALISAVIKAVREGKIDLEDDDEDEDTSPAEDSEDSEEVEVAVDINDLNNPDMTKERANAIRAYESEVRADFKNGDLDREQLVEWLNEFHNTKNTMKKMSDDEILDEYIYCSCLLINDEGEMPEEEGAYTVNGIPFCCGRELAYNEDNETYICEACGAEYEAGEE